MMRRVFQLCLSIWLASLSGCLRWGYDPVPRPEAPGSPDAGAYAGDSRDSGSAPVEPARDAAISDAGLDVDDAGTYDAATHDAAADGGDDGDAGVGPACPGELNACGGCEVLNAAPGSSCGACGLGLQVCSGSEALACMGGSTTPVTSGGPLVLDAFEDGDRLFRAGAIHGDWYLVSDGTAGVLNPATDEALVPVSPGARESKGALHVSGSGFSDWGGGVQGSLNLEACYVDVAAQTGISFYARGTGTVLFSVATHGTIPMADGGACVGNCYDNFALSFTLTSAWKPYQLPWSMLRQAGWGTVTTFQPKQAKYLQFSFAAGSSMDLYLDDLSLY